MKLVKNFAVAVLLAFFLAVSAPAGEVQMPGVASPTPTPQGARSADQAKTDSYGDPDAVDAGVDQLGIARQLAVPDQVELERQRIERRGIEAKHRHHHDRHVEERQHQPEVHGQNCGTELHSPSIRLRATG